MRINLTTPMSDDKESKRHTKAVIDAIERYTEEKMSDEYGRIHADGKRIAELEAEVERLTYDGIHSCHGQCQRVACVLERRIAELETALRDIATGRYSGVVLTSIPLKDAAVERARAALGETK